MKPERMDVQPSCTCGSRVMLSHRDGLFRTVNLISVIGGFLESLRLSELIARTALGPGKGGSIVSG